MRKLEYLSPIAQTMLHYIGATGIGADKDFGMPAVIIVMRKKGYTIGQVVTAIDECATAGWLVRHAAESREPDRLALTDAGALTLALQAAE